MQLVVARIGVGFGEASVSPSAFSLISDYLARSMIGRALSLVTVSSYVGSAMALAVGGVLLANTTSYTLRTRACRLDCCPGRPPSFPSRFPESYSCHSFFYCERLAVAALF